MRVVRSPQRERVWLVYRELRSTSEEYELLMQFVRQWAVPLRVGASDQPDLALVLGPMSPVQDEAFAQAFGDLTGRWSA